MITLLATIVISAYIDKLAAGLLLPYITLWITFATALNYPHLGAELMVLLPHGPPPEQGFQSGMSAGV